MTVDPNFTKVPILGLHHIAAPHDDHNRIPTINNVHLSVLLIVSDRSQVKEGETPAAKACYWYHVANSDIIL